jgi:aldose 1-epimerase
MQQIRKKTFFTLPDGRFATYYELRNGTGMTASFCDYGAVITSIIVPDRNGIPRDVTLGFCNPSDYIENRHHFGAVIGRYANRIRHGCFTIDGRKYQIPPNNPFGHAQHGGTQGFHQALWDVEVDGDTLIFSHISADGEQGFPGNLTVQVRYSLTGHNELRIEYQAAADKPTVLNITNHSYFNLSGCHDRLIDNHEVFINAGSYVEVDSEGIPTGRILPVDNTPLDLRQSRKLRSGLESDHQLIADFYGFDQNYVLNHTYRTLQTPNAAVFCRESGILMEMFTTEPAVGFYTGNFLGSKLPGKGGLPYRKHSGLCLEAQHYPDSVNHPEFPTTVLRPVEKYTQKTIYRFSVVEQMPTQSH